MKEFFENLFFCGFILSLIAMASGALWALKHYGVDQTEIHSSHYKDLYEVYKECSASRPAIRKVMKDGWVSSEEYSEFYSKHYFRESLLEKTKEDAVKLEEILDE